VDSGWVTAHVSKLPVPKIAIESGLLTQDIEVNNATNIWLLPNFGFENAYGENGNFSGWSQTATFSTDVPPGDFRGSFFCSSAVNEFSVNRVSYSYGRSYSMAGWFKGDGAALIPNLGSTHSLVCFPLRCPLQAIQERHAKTDARAVRWSDLPRNEPWRQA
jgi:hypothetical protein